MSQPPPNPTQQNMIQTIQPAQATRLLEALKEELAKAKAAGPDTTKARQHYARAEQIKQVLVNYRQQQQQRQAAAARASTAGNFPANQTTPGGATASPGISAQNPPNTVPVSAPAHTNQAQFHSSTAGTRPGTSGFAAGSNTIANTGPGAGLGQTGGPSAMNNLNVNTNASQIQVQGQPQQQQQTQQTQQTQPRSGIYATTQMPNTLPEGMAQQQQQQQQQRPASVTPGVTTEKYNRVRSSLQDLERKIRTFEAGKRADMSAEENTQFENQLRELKLKFAQYSKFALYMQNQLLELARNGTSTAGSPVPRAGTPGAVNAPNTVPSTTTPGQSIHTPVITNALQVASNVNANINANPNANPNVNVNAVGSVSGPGNSHGGISEGIHPGGGSVSGSGSNAAAATTTTLKNGSRGPSPSVKEPTVPGVNLSLITKASVPSIPILSTINVKPQNPITLKPGANNVRPTLTAGGSSGLGQVVNSPAMMRMPTFDMASTGPIQDNGGRVLTKRKLTELVNTIGADEGDGKTTIDGDVEELLLDLADEFVSSVTTFACRLAKHRKTDAIDVRDVQLHLERNWNIRIPGHSTDEIRSMRKWQPSSAYTQKVSGVDIVKAVNGNIT